MKHLLQEVANGMRLSPADRHEVGKWAGSSFKPNGAVGAVSTAAMADEYAYQSFHGCFKSVKKLATLLNKLADDCKARARRGARRRRFLSPKNKWRA